MQGKQVKINRKFETGAKIDSMGWKISSKNEGGGRRFFVCYGIDTCSIGFYNRGNEKTYIKVANDLYELKGDPSYE